MKIKHFIIGVILAMTLASCGTEFKLAKSFVDRSKDARVAVYFPEAVKVTLIQDKDGDYTQVLDSVNQNMFLDIMYAAYADALRHYGLDVYIPEDQDHVQVDSTHWLVILSNMEIQGLYTDYVDHLFDFTDEYDYTFALNTVNVASWFDINDGEWHPTLFDEHNLRDDFDSYVTHGWEQGTQYHYNITPLKTGDVYNYAVYLGKRYAEYTYDYMMNRYVVSEMAKNGKMARFKLRWDPDAKAYYFLPEEEEFIELRGER
jgi:hypothetical protein